MSAKSRPKSSSPSLEEGRALIEQALGVSDVDWWAEEAVRMILGYRAHVEKRRIYDVSSFGARVRTAREIVGLTQHQLARRLAGKTLPDGRRKPIVGWTVSAWERGRHGMPATHLPGLAMALGVSVAWLLGDSDQGAPPMPGGLLRRQRLVDWSHASMRVKKRAQARAELERMRGLRGPKRAKKTAPQCSGIQEPENRGA